MKPTSRAARYMPQLDGLRAFAATLVMVSHFGVFDRIDLLRLPGRSLGAAGVDLFFVLSGFLITGILLRARATANAQGSKGALRAELLRFYARRSLRIFPIHYLSIAILFWAGAEGVRDNLGWYLSYTINGRLALDPIDLYPATPFWTLAVEEQFYLVWPTLILLAPLRRLRPAVLALLLVGVTTRTALYFSGAHVYTLAFNTGACLDSLGLGALLAILSHERNTAWLRQLVRAGLWIGVPGTLAVLATARGAEDLRFWAFLQPFAALASVWLIERASRGRRDLLGRLLESKPLTAVGRISYGLYLYHLPVQWALQRGLQESGWSPAFSTKLALLFGITYAVATVSWWCIERPALRLKRHF